VSESTERCAICLEFFRVGDTVERAHGASVHPACIEHKRKPGAKVERPAPPGVKNARTDNGEPICPVCAEPIALGQGAARSREYMLHVTCWDRGGRAPQPQGR
jgi:hypothetical protein